MIARLSPEQRTLGITYRPGRFARIRLAYPEGWRPSRMARFRKRNRYPVARSHPAYDPDLAIELVGRTGELPTSKHDLVVLLTEYRHALIDLATQALNVRQEN